ncbi:hypothetical protein TL16_g09597 [Triparma laevis f. inornata]|uniref:TRIP4/RQT4 C2HC5-type zinc finger domain-containing protein n=2 Tax=Triparma laevis TaxID=1534972 RepID=A0A9W7FJS6_9STRA|nr:hypothetical protein TL16_g09597 [Triparma laevis f. inornata]GMI13468.1 hypothetical protein TrLO_g4203 [Triparma laevis f. longispina]
MAAGLSARLCGMLGMDDVVEIINYLGSVDDSDVPEYLQSLLGDSAEVKSWSNDYLSARNAGTLKAALTADHAVVPAPTPAPAATPSPAPALLPDKIMGVPVRRIKGVHMDPKTNTKKSFNKPQTQKTDHTVDVPPPAPAPSKPPPAPKPIIITPLRTGNRTSPTCGCFGSLHKILTNCLTCGYLTCTLEVYDFCPHCKVEILPIKKSSGNLSSAEIHKRRLLEFDRESAKRTVIFDDQADYFSNTNSAWLTEEERKEAGVSDEANRRDIHERVKRNELNLGAII